MVRRRHSPWTFLLLGWTAATIVMTGWAIASPIGSGPDETGHIMKAAATVRGQWHGTPTGDPGITTFRLPADIGDTGSLPCYIGDPDVSARCSPSLDDFGPRTVTVRSGVGDYNPLYYLVVGAPSLFVHGDLGVILMRVVSAALNGFFAGVLLYVAASLRASPGFTAWVAIAITPMTSYLGGVLNPNGVEVTGCAALAAVAWLVVHDRSPGRLPERAVLLATCGIVAGNARAVSPVFVAAIVVAVVLSARLADVVPLFRRRSVLAAAGASVIGLLGAGVWTLRIAGPGGFIPASDPARDALVPAFFRTLGTTGAYGEMMIGVLGWLDVHLPSAVVVGWTAALGFVLLAALGSGRRRMVLASVLLMAATLFGPALVQAPTVEQFGYIWQGRYGLPAFVAMVLVAGLTAEQGFLRSVATVRLVPVIVTLAGAAHCAAFAIAYKRYSVGVGHGWRTILEPGSWQAPGGAVVLGALFGTGVLFLAVVSIAASRRSAVGRLPRCRSAN